MGFLNDICSLSLRRPSSLYNPAAIYAQQGNSLHCTGGKLRVAEGEVVEILYVGRIPSNVGFNNDRPFCLIKLYLKSIAKNMDDVLPGILIDAVVYVNVRTTQFF